MDKRTENFIELLAYELQLESNRHALEPYLDILENMSYVLPYSKNELVSKFNEYLQ